MTTSEEKAGPSAGGPTRTDAAAGSGGEPPGPGEVGNAWGRVIAHVDMDAFYASIEIRDDPSLEGKPVVVGGEAGSRGVVSAASYAAREYGVHSAMPMAEALRKCPHLIRLPGDMRKYQSVSRQIMEVLSHYSPTVEPLSLDEAFLDLSGMSKALGTPEEIAVRIQEEIWDVTHLTASVGVAPVKFVAKIASDFVKPRGRTIVRPGEVEAFLHPLPLSRLWGVGPRTLAVLEGLTDLMPARTAKMVAEGHALRAELDTLLTDDTVLLYPPYATTAPRHDVPLMWPFLWVYTAVLNVMQLPVTQVPLGLDTKCLPLGLQVGGGHGQDHLTMSVAMELERAFGGWVRPPRLEAVRSLR